MFRVSGSEYEVLHKACAESGARSLSDFSRSILLGRAKHSGGESDHPGSLEVLREKVAELEVRLKMISDALNRKDS